MLFFLSEITDEIIRHLESIGDSRLPEAFTVRIQADVFRLIVGTTGQAWTDVRVGEHTVTLVSE